MEEEVTCIGAGRLGVCSMLAIAEHVPNCHITILDPDFTVINPWINGDVPFREPGLAALINQHRNNAITFDTDIPASIQRGSTIFLAVELKTDHKAIGCQKDSMDCTKWHNMVLMIRDHSQMPKNVIDKSGALFGQENKLRILLESGPGVGGNVLHHYVYSNPEFFRRGSAMADVLNPTRVVLGMKSGHNVDRILSYYNWNNPNTIVVLNNHNGAEMSSLINSIYSSATCIIANLGASLCQKTGVASNDVLQVIRRDRRFRHTPIPHGSVGGPVLVRDLRYSIYLCRFYGLEIQRKVLESLLSLNKNLVQSFQDTIRDNLVTLRNKTVVVLGFGFKPSTCDISESPAIPFCQYLIRQGARVRVLDRHVLADRILSCFSERAIDSEQIIVMDHQHLVIASQQADAVCCVVRSNYFPARFHEQLAGIAQNMRRPAYFFDFTANHRFIHQEIGVMGLRSYAFGLG